MNKLFGLDISKFGQQTGPLKNWHTTYKIPELIQSTDQFIDAFRNGIDELSGRCKKTSELK